MLAIVLEVMRLRENENFNSPSGSSPTDSPPSKSSPIKSTSSSSTTTPSPSLSPTARPILQPEDVGPIGLPFDVVIMEQKAAVFSFTNSSEQIPNTNIWKPYECDIYLTPFTSLSNITETFFIVEDYQEFISANYEGSSGLWGSKETNFFEWTDVFYEEDFSFSIVHNTWSIFEAVLTNYEDIALSEAFLLDLRRVNVALGGEYSYQLIYEQLIAKYGTNVPFSANYGGYILYSSYLMNCIARQHSKSWVMQQTQAVFDIMVDGSSTTTVDQVMYDATYHSSSLLIKGGPSIPATTLTPEIVNQWIAGIGQNPVYLGISGYWLKLSDLLPPDLSDLAAMFSQAIDEYISSSVPSQPQMVTYIYPYVAPLDYVGAGCLGTCTDTCLGQNACPGQGACEYAVGLTVMKNSQACDYDDDDCGFEDNCIRKKQGQGYCAMACQDCHRTCWASYLFAYPTKVACSSAATCYPS